MSYQGRLIPDPADYNIDYFDEFASLSPACREEIEKATFEADMRNPDGVWEEVAYPKFFWWRFNQIFGNSDEFLIITPDMMDEYFKEPDDPLQTRCPRCMSIEVIIGYPDMVCQSCGYNEPLIDFPMSESFYGYYEAMLPHTRNNLE